MNINTNLLFPTYTTFAALAIIEFFNGEFNVEQLDTIIALRQNNRSEFDQLFAMARDRVARHHAAFPSDMTCGFN